MTIIFQRKLLIRGRWAPSRAGCWHQYWECRSSGFSLWDVQSILLLWRECSVFCSCIWFSLCLSAGDLMLSSGIGFFTYDNIRSRSGWFSMGRSQRMGWALAPSSSNRAYTGDDFVAFAAVNLQLLGKETTSSVLVHGLLWWWGFTHVSLSKCFLSFS